MIHKPAPSAAPPPLALEDLVISYKEKPLSTDELLHAIELGRHILSCDSPEEIANDLRGLAQIFWGLDHEDNLGAIDWQAVHFLGKILDEFAIRVNREARPRDVTLAMKAPVKAVA